MVGGKIIEVTITSTHVGVVVSDQPHSNDRRSFSFKVDKQTRCIGTGDSLWWQHDVFYWTPSGSEKKRGGKDFDIVIGERQPRKQLV